MRNVPSEFACPFCNTPAGQDVYSGIFNDQFWSLMVLTSAPVAIMLAIATLTYFGLPRGRGRGSRRVHDGSPFSGQETL